MLEELFPVGFARYLKLPLFGPIVSDFDDWLLEQSYRRGTRRNIFKALARVDRFLGRRGFKCFRKIKESNFTACRAWYRRRDILAAAAVGAIQRFMDERKLLCPSEPTQSPIEIQVRAYSLYLLSVRGLSLDTRKHHAFTISRFLEHLKYDRFPSRLSNLGIAEVDEFVCSRGKTLGRGALQHTVSHLRGFLRFMATRGVVCPGLEKQIEKPRIYRLEQLPRTLPWSVVRSLIQSIDRRTATGLRDFAMFSLIASYGLRSCQVVSLKLDDIHWKERWIHVAERKKGSAFRLPLTDPVATALMRYIRRGRPPLSQRELFLRAYAPAGTLKPTAVTEAFQYWSRRSGLDIPFHGAHCIRHSYAVHLLRRGTPLKMIGDLLGHRSVESTYMYLRLNTEDLRTVALPIPRGRCSVVRMGVEK